MSSACPNCEQTYDKNNWKPLILSCGNVMCQKCLIQFKEKQKICILCEKSWADSSVESLPICSQLIPGENSKPVRTLWCNTCHSSTCGKNAAKETEKCHLILLNEKCLQQAIEYTEFCKKISIKKSTYKRCFEEMASMCKTLKKDICVLSHLESHNGKHFIVEDDSDENVLAILSDKIKKCQESLPFKLPVTTSPLLSPVLSALQVNCYLMTIIFQSLLHHCCLLSCLLSR